MNRMLYRPVRRPARGAALAVALVASLTAVVADARESLGPVNVPPSPGIVDPATAAARTDASSPPPVARPRLEPRATGIEAGTVGDPLAFASLLEPGGIERPHWHSFDGAVPDLAPRPATAPRFVVVIDPGHGGSDPGAEGPNGLLEKHLTLDIARRVQLFLSEIDGIRVVLTRERDHGLSRGSRVAAVRRSEADLFVSLHFNHLPQSEITLVESYYAGPENIAESLTLQHGQADEAGRRGQADKPATARRASAAALPDLSFTRGSARFARLLQRRVHDEVGRQNPAALDAGVKRETLFVLTRSFTSGALIELTCLSNAAEAERLTDVHYRNALAAGLADAIREYRSSLENDPPRANGA